jgi:uncharacterized repeat protein (TIGR03803 family)
MTFHRIVRYAGVLAFALVIHVQDASAEMVLYSFCGQQDCVDGWTPYAGLLNVGGILYGTLPSGGADNAGAVFSINPTSGAETTVYSFQQNGTDGHWPYASLTNVKDTLYGTTWMGGAYTQGAVFSINPATGAETVLYSFCSQQNCADGAQPLAGLLNVNGTLYATTSSGGAHSYEGAVISIDLSTRAEAVLYSFCSQQNCADGASPVSDLMKMNGVLYGTTLVGGAYDAGTVFSLDPTTGKETVLHSFCSKKNCADGSSPHGGLVNVAGTLYSTTEYGGAYNKGTVFAINPTTGAETILYSFCSQQDCIDGSVPFAGVVAVKGNLYGSTVEGGGNDKCDGFGCGTVFAVDISTGDETVLHSFCSKKKCSDGSEPFANLVAVNGILYGTTVAGGENCKRVGGCGTVFSTKP